MKKISLVFASLLIMGAVMSCTGKQNVENITPNEGDQIEMSTDSTYRIQKDTIQMINDSL